MERSRDIAGRTLERLSGERPWSVHLSLTVRETSDGAQPVTIHLVIVAVA